MKNCKYCGTLNQAEANICANCGASLLESNNSDINNLNNDKIVNNNNNNKKKIVIIVSLIIVIACIGFIVLLFGKKSSTKGDNSTTSSVASTSSSTTTTTTEAKQQNSDYYFWKDTLKKSETKQISKIFNSKYEIPVTEKFMTSHNWDVKLNLGYVNGKELEKIKDYKTFSSSPVKWGYGKCYKWDKVSLSNELSKTRTGTYSLKFELINPNEKECYSIKESFDSGFYSIEHSAIPESDIGINLADLGIQSNGEQIYNKETKKYEIFDKIIETYGSPSYILAHGDFNENHVRDDKESNAVTYTMIYEYDEYVIVLPVSEHIMPKYNFMKSNITSIIYYPRKGWDTYYKNQLQKDRKVYYLT